MRDVPYIVYESEMARLERIIKRQFILIIASLIFLVGTNLYWVYYESQFQDVVTTQEVTQDVQQDSDNGNNTFIGGDNVEAESETDSKNNNQDPQEENGR